jgi:hypothetical protein
MESLKENKPLLYSLIFSGGAITLLTSKKQNFHVDCTCINKAKKQNKIKNKQKQNIKNVRSILVNE